VLKTGGTATIIAPYWSNPCAYGDPTHQWPPVTEWAPLYWNRDWRAANAPHAGYTCDFDTVTGFGFDSRIQIGAGQQQLAHVRHVEQARILARPIVLGDDPFILDRHVIARKRHHPCPARTVPAIQRQRVQRQVFDVFFGVLVSHLGNPRQNKAVLRRPQAPPRYCPLCRVT
jgi:hypothetical protein